jgi:hypothetical protein
MSELQECFGASVERYLVAGLLSSLRRVRSSWASRSGSARKSISTIFPFSTVKAPTENGLPSRIETIPGAPLTRARRIVRPICDQQSAWPANLQPQLVDEVVLHQRAVSSSPSRYRDC